MLLRLIITTLAGKICSVRCELGKDRDDLTDSSGL